MSVTVRYFAGARAAAGLAEERTDAASLQELLDLIGTAHGPGLRRVLGAASYLVDGVSVQDPAYRLPAGATVDVLPPFAGG